jgi:hypothetical protein
VLFAPAASGIPPYSDKLRRSTRTSEKGAKGVLPLGYLPLWGREGVTLLYPKENWQVTGKRRFQQSQKNNPCVIFLKKNFPRIIRKTSKNALNVLQIASTPLDIYGIDSNISIIVSKRIPSSASFVMKGTEDPVAHIDFRSVR